MQTTKHLDMESDDVWTERDQISVLVGVSFLIGLAIGFAASRWATSQDLPWFAAHPELTGILTFIVALVLGRTYLFMRRLESR